MEKYYNGVVEQLLSGVGKTPYNSYMVRYSGEFSIRNLDIVEKLQARTDVYFSAHEFCDGEIGEGYEPYLSIICDMFRKHMTGSFEDFLEECDVYYLHRPAILGYFNDGICWRNEPVLLDEVAYEQERMTSAMEKMLLRLAEECPIVILLNQFQFATRSTLTLTERLISGENRNIGLLLSVNDALSIPKFLASEWDAINEKLEDGRRVYHIGNSGQKKKKASEQGKNADYSGEVYEKLCNQVAFLDIEQASYVLSKIERRIKFDNTRIEDEAKYKLLRLLARVSILTQDIPKTLEICEDLEKMHLPEMEQECLWERSYLIATAYMYQGRLAEALEYARMMQQAAKKLKDEYRIFLAELMESEIQMSGWYNIFFCAQDVSVSDELINKLMKYNFKNHLAHIYVYAYDNTTEVIAKAYRSEELLLNFSKGVRLAKEIGNEYLVTMAYQKNIMLASTNGMYEIALLYDVRTFEVMRDKTSVEAGRLYSGIAYNLCAMGQNELAQKYYDRSISLFYRLRRPEDIAEVEYNKAMDCIMCGKYGEAELYLNWCMKAVEKLHLNSLRVCNLSKLYGLLALVTILQGNRFRCEQYIENCRQFLNYVLEKEKLGGGDFNIVHDYAKVDDDMFLYTFARALLAHYDGDDERAVVLYERAEEYLKHSEGNQFFSQALFRRSRMECFLAMGKDQLYQKEKETLEQYEESNRSAFGGFMDEIIKKLPAVGEASDEITMEQLDELLWQESMVVAYRNKKRQLDFIPVWQGLIDVIDAGAANMMDGVMKAFLNHFNVDCAVYVRYREWKPQVLFNNTGRKMDPEVLERLERSLKQNPGGFVISKTSSNYTEHQDVTTLFGEDDVCSMVAVPYFNNESLESFLITYVLMKDNWHSSINRYMLDEDDLSMFQMLFREVKYSLNRIDAYDKIYEMNNKLYLSAVTDQLTGIYNREGFYRKLNSLLTEFAKGEREPNLGLMFIDLDNFKHYNDTFGHDVGDLILIKMAEIFKKLSDNRGFVCRYGGDEFIIVFYNADKPALEEWAGQIYQQIADAKGFQKEISESSGKEVTIAKERWISCSIGIVLKENITDEEEINAMIKQADDLLYTIKTSTKGTYRI